MPLKNLNSIFRKGKPAAVLVESFLQDCPEGAFIENMSGKVLVSGRSEDRTLEKHTLESDDVLHGYFYGPAHIAELVRFVISREAEKKTLGNEILTLYREINLIYNFSESLSMAPGKEAIGHLALEEARSIIHATAGLVWLTEGGFGNIASFGGLNWDQVATELLYRLKGLNGNGDKSVILNDYKCKEGAHAGELFSLVFAPLKIKDSMRGFIVLLDADHGDYKAGDLKLLSTIALMSASSVETAILYERNLQEVKRREMQLKEMNGVMTKFVPHQFIQALGHENITDVKLGDKVEREVTVFFSDVRDYTSISESMSLAQNFEFISKYHQAVGPLIRKYGGFITQYLGDGIMAVFPGSSDESVMAAIEMQQTVKDADDFLKVGMGMHTGPLIMGVIGDPDRMDAATIADTVNSASRMEGLCKYYGARIVISHATFSRLTISDRIAWRSLGTVQVKGKVNATEIYDVFEADDDRTRDLKNSTRERFNAGISSFQDGRFEEATAHFAQVLSLHPEDKASHFYLNRSILYQTDKVMRDSWNGVEVMDYK